MSYGRTEIAVGTFLLLGMAVVLWGIAKSGNFGLGATQARHSYYDNVNTIEVGSSVKFNGMLVGRVSEISIDPERPAQIRVDYDISTAEGLRITERMEAKITKADLLGDEYIDIRIAGAAQGSSEALLAAGTELPPGAPIPAGEPFDLQRALEDLQGTITRVDVLLDTAQSEVETALAEINSILVDAHDLFSDESRENVAAAITDVAATSAQLRSLLDDNKGRVESIFSRVDSATGHIDAVSADVKDTVATLRPDLEKLTDKLQSAVTQLEAALVTASNTLDTLDVAQVNEVVENLDVASRNLAEFTHEIKQRPYRLIRKEKQPPKEFR